MRRNAYLYCILAFGFLLGVYNGYVALWEDENSPAPSQVFPYAVTALPEADQRALEEGIPVAYREQLTKYLEDFLS